MVVHTVRSDDPLASGSGPTTPGMVVVGWFVLCFAIIPLAMAVHGDGRVYTNLALGMLVIGALLIVFSRLGRPRGNPPGSTGVAA